MEFEENNNIMILDPSGIDISGTGKIIIDSSGDIVTSGDISANDISVNSMGIKGMTFPDPNQGVNGNVLKIESGVLAWGQNTATGISVEGAASTIAMDNLTESKALISNSSGKVAVSTVTDVELSYLTGVTDNIQAQITNATTSGGSIVKANEGPADATPLTKLEINGVSHPISGGGGGSQWTSTSNNQIYYNSGNVGIGTDVPTNKLDVSGGLTVTNGPIITNGIRLQGNNLGTLNNSRRWDNNGSKIFYTGGNVGIGSNNPKHRLVVNGTIQANSIILGSSAIATENFVNTRLLTKQNVLTYNPPSSNNTNPSTSAQIKSALDLKADLAGPTFTGEPSAPTVTTSDNSTKLATTEFVHNVVDASINALIDSAPGTLNTLNELAAALGDDSNYSTTVTNSLNNINSSINTINSSINTINNTIDPTSPILFSNMYSSYANLPNATTYHGMFAHAHSEGKAYYSHAGNWIKLIDENFNSFTELNDTPSSLTANKYLAVNSSGNAIELVDAPSGGGGGGSSTTTVVSSSGGGSDILLFFADVINASVHASNSIVNIYTSYKYSINGGGKESAFSNPIVKGSNFIASSEASTTTSWGTYVRKLTLPAGIPSELEVIMKGRVCGQGNGEAQLIVKRGSNTIYNRELGATAYACGQFTVNHIFTDFKEGDTLEFYLNENNGAGTTNGDPVVFNFTDGGNKQRGSITIKALNNIGGGSGGSGGYINLINNEKLVTQKGQTLETIAGVCDGRTVEVESGTYTLPAVTQPQECADGSPWTELTGSKISYKPPAGAKQVIYKLHVHISGTEFNTDGSTSGSFMTSMRIKLDNNIITNFDYHEGGTANLDTVVVLTAIFDIGSEDNLSEAKLLNWNSNKEIKIEVTAYPWYLRTTMYHSAQYRNDPTVLPKKYITGHSQTQTTIQVIKPRMEIKAIGEKTEKANATYVVAKQSEMRVSHDKANIKALNTYIPDVYIDGQGNLIDDAAGTAGNIGWAAGQYQSQHSRFNTTTGQYTGSASTTLLTNPYNSSYTGLTYSGIWFDWEFFEKVSVKQLRIAGSQLVSDNSARSPGKYRLAGSNDGSNWYSLTNEITVTHSDYYDQTISSVVKYKFSETDITVTNSYKFYRLMVGAIVSGSNRSQLVMSEVELIGKIEIDSYPVNNTTLVVANSKGIRVTHDKANIKAFTYPVDELTSWSDQRRPEGLTDDKGIYSYDGYNMYHTTYANSSSIFDANGDYIGWNGTVQSTSGYNAHWMQWEFISKVKISSIRVMGSSYSGGNLHKQSVPTNAKLFGSNDASTWVQIGNDLNETQQSAFFDGDTPKWKEFTINANKEYKYIRYAVSKVYGKYGTSNLCYLAIAELEMFGDVIVEQAGVTNIIKGQTLETIAGIADGRTLEGKQQSYTLDNVTQLLEIRENTDGNPDENQVYPIGTDGITPGHVGVTGSKIENYTLLRGTKQIVYIFTCHVSSLSQWTTITFNLLIDNQVVHGQHRGDGSNQYRNGTVSARFVIDITDGVEDISLGKINWSVGQSKTIRLEASDRYRAVLHTGNQYINDTYPHQQNEIIKPQVELTAIGEKTTVNSFVPHDGMTIQTQHKDYKKKVAKDNAYWDPIDNDLDTGFVVKIQPTSQNSKVMINANVHIGIKQTDDARWWGAKLYRKIGSGGWNEVLEANGDNSVTTIGGTNSVSTGSSVWFSNTQGLTASYDATINNSSASFLDSPNTTQTVYYTIYWASRLGNLSSNILIYLNRAHEHGDLFRPSPISSITASEIWSSGSPYIPPTDGVISVYNNKIGIDNTTPSYDLDVSGNINFTGTLYHDGVAFSGGGGTTSSLIGPFKLISSGRINENSWGHFKFERKIASTDYGAIGFDAGSSAGGTNVEEAICIKRTGQVGIGTNSPESMLQLGSLAQNSEVNSPSDSQYKKLGLTSPYHNAGFYFATRDPTANDACLDIGYNHNSNNSLDRPNIMTINDDGNVGIGTTNPICPLHINGYNELGSSGWPTIGAGSAGTFHYFLRASNHAGHTHWVTDNRIDQSTGTYSWSNPNGISLQTISRLSIFCENVIRAQYYVAPSDNRIKTDISLINDETALNQVNAIETYEYHYIDPIRRNPIKTIGFIAQEVKNVIPNAVGLITDTVPDELRIVENPIWIDCSYCSIRYEPKFTYTETITYKAEVVLDNSGNPMLDQSGNQIIDPSAIEIIDPSGIEHVDTSGIVIEEWHPKWKLQIPDLDISTNNTGRCRFYFSNDISGNDEIMKELKLDTSSNDTFEAIDSCYNNVFFYGKEVNDFHTLDKAQIFALHHSAIQELSRENNKLKEENNELKNRLDALELAVINLQNN